MQEASEMIKKSEKLGKGLECLMCDCPLKNEDDCFYCVESQCTMGPICIDCLRACSCCGYLACINCQSECNVCTDWYCHDCIEEHKGQGCKEERHLRKKKKLNPEQEDGE
jgi:hypothetical protein